MKRYLAVLFLSGCAAQPISTTVIPQTDLDQCVRLSEQHSIAGRAALRGGVEAARAAGVAKAMDTLAGAAGLTFPVGWIFAGYAVTSAINGVIEGQDRRDQIVRECLKDRGFRVY